MTDGPVSVRAAGAVLWRAGPKGPEVALIHRPRYDDWTFPKGKCKSDEHILRTALREVEEETGIRPVLGRRLSASQYLKDGALKQVEYWAATGAGGPPPGGPEVDRMEWLPAADAERWLSYERDVELLREFTDRPVRTTPLLVVRHTSAGEKRDWTDDDLLRPLDARGRADAADLADLMACYGPTRVVSSATARCVETMLPFAAQLGLAVRAEQAFTVGAGAEAGDELAALLADGQPTVVCTHGEQVPALVWRACKELDAQPPAEPALRKGHFWVLQVAGRELVSTERHSGQP